MTNDNPDPFTQSGVGGGRDFRGADGVVPAVTDDQLTGDQGYAFDDSASAHDAQADSSAFRGVGGTSGTNLGAYGSEPGGSGSALDEGGTSTASGAGSDAPGQARHLASTATDAAGEVARSAAAGAGEVKDVALERGGDVAAVAKDELGRLAGDAREQLQGLWDQTGSQLREQVTAGRQQLAGVLHDLADELGQMASKSDQNGPVTAFAKQASRRGGELSHWLSNAESSDVLAEVRRFARRRPFAFLAGATVAGVVVGRLSRGLMAGRNTAGSSGATRAAEATGVPAPRPAATVPAYGGGSAGQTYGYDRAATGGEQL